MLVPSIKGVSWLSHFEAAIATQAQYWGGQFNLVLPLIKGDDENEVFWSLLDLQDPDGTLLAGLSYADMETIDPAWYASWVEGLREHLADDFDHLGSETVEQTIEQFRESPALNVTEPSQALQQKISNRLGILDEDSAALEVTGSHGPGWPWMDASKFDGLPDSIDNPVIGRKCGQARRLWATTQHGRIASGLRRELDKNQVQVNDLLIRTSKDWSTWLSRHSSQAHLPWTLNERGIAAYGRHQAGLLPAVVVGDSPWDFALFYALRRWTAAAWWYPSGLGRDLSYRHYLGRDIGRSHAVAREVAVVTTSATNAVLRRAITELREVLPRNTSASGHAWKEVLPDHPRAYYEWGGEGRPSPIPIVEGTTPALPTPVPTRVRARDPLEMHWITEVRVDDWAPVRCAGMGGNVLPALQGTQLARTSSRGVAYFCPDSMVLGGNALESSVIRPQMAQLPILDQVRSLLAPSERRCRLSDKGVWAAESVDLFGGLEEACDALRDAGIRPILDEFVRRQESGERPYLTFDNAQKLLGDLGPLVMQDLVTRGIVLRGLHVKCVRCRRGEWRSLEDVGDGFICSRCALEQPIQAGFFLGGREPAWVYRLAEVVMNLLVHNGDLPLLTIWDVFGASPAPLDIAYEVEILGQSDDRTLQEVDMVVSDGHQLWLGEATTSGKLKDVTKRARQLSRLADDLHARGAILATSQGRLQPQTVAAFKHAFPGPWPILRLETGVSRG